MHMKKCVTLPRPLREIMMTRQLKFSPCPTTPPTSSLSYHTPCHACMYLHPRSMIWQLPWLPRASLQGPALPPLWSASEQLRSLERVVSWELPRCQHLPAAHNTTTKICMPSRKEKKITKEVGKWHKISKPLQTLIINNLHGNT